MVKSKLFMKQRSIMKQWTNISTIGNIESVKEIFCTANILQLEIWQKFSLIKITFLFMFQRQHLIVQITRHLLSLIVLMMIENTKKLKFGDKMQHKFGLERYKFVKFNFKCRHLNINKKSTNTLNNTLDSVISITLMTFFKNKLKIRYLAYNI